MKKALIVLTMATMLTACSTSDAQSTAAPAAEIQETIDAESDDVADDVSDDETNDETNDETDENLGDTENVSFTVPDYFFEDMDIDEIIAMNEADGIETIVEEDGSITMVMTKAAHNEMMEDISNSLYESFNEIASSDLFPSILEVTSNDSFTEITMNVNKEEYEESFEEFAMYEFAVQIQVYHAMNGTSDAEFIFNVVDSASGETFQTSEFPNAWYE